MVHATTERYPVWEFQRPASHYGNPAESAVRVRDNHVQFANGARALCANSGLWNVNLGYGNPVIAKAVADSLIEASYLSLFRAGHIPAVTAARALLEVCGPEWFGRVLFATSGSAANDAVMKLARHYWVLRGEPRRLLIVGLRDSYHGMTYGSFSLTGAQLGQATYGIDYRSIRHVAYDDPAELTELLDREGRRVAAVVLEPVLGLHARPLPDAMLSALGRLRAEHGFLLAADEVATGFGRTGQFFASFGWDARPDVLVTSKGLTNGTCAASAVVVSHDICEAFEASDSFLVHGETQAGAPSSCAAIIATIDEMHRLGACDRAVKLADQLETALSRLSRHPLVTGTRGMSCFRALELSDADGLLSPEAIRVVVARAREAGVLTQPGIGCVLIVPSLTYTQEELQEMESCLLTGLDRAAEDLLA